MLCDNTSKSLKASVEKANSKKKGVQGSKKTRTNFPLNLQTKIIKIQRDRERECDRIKTTY